MVWVVGLGIFALLFFAFPAFRAVTAVTIGLGVLAGLYFYVNQQQEEQAAKKLIAADQIEFRSLRLTSTVSSYKLLGEVRNNSLHELTSATLNLKAYDCPAQSITPDCSIIGEDDDVYVSATVPSNQVRAVDAYVSFYNMPEVKGHFLWSYFIAETRGRN